MQHFPAVVIGFGKQDINADGLGVKGLDTVDETGHDGTRPRPLAIFFYALAVNGNDYRRLADPGARFPLLVAAELGVADCRIFKIAQGHAGQKQDYERQPAPAPGFQCGDDARCETTHKQMLRPS